MLALCPGTTGKRNQRASPGSSSVPVIPASGRVVAPVHWRLSWPIVASTYGFVLRVNVPCSRLLLSKLEPLSRNP